MLRLARIISLLLLGVPAFAQVTPFGMFQAATTVTYASIVYDTMTAKTWGTGVTTSSWTGRVNAGTNRCAVALLMHGTITNQLDSVKWGTQKFTFARLQDRIDIWYLVNPDTGSLTVQWWGTSNQGLGGMMSFTGVNQETPVGTGNGANASSAGPISYAVTTEAGDMVVTLVGTIVVTYTKDAAQITTFNGDNGVGWLAWGTRETATGVSTTISGTLSASQLWCAESIPLKRATQ